MVRKRKPMIIIKQPQCNKGQGGRRQTEEKVLHWFWELGKDKRRFSSSLKAGKNRRRNFSWVLKVRKRKEKIPWGPFPSLLWAFSGFLRVGEGQRMLEKAWEGPRNLLFFSFWPSEPMRNCFFCSLRLWGCLKIFFYLFLALRINEKLLLLSVFYPLIALRLFDDDHRFSLSEY